MSPGQATVNVSLRLTPETNLSDSNVNMLEHLPLPVHLHQGATSHIDRLLSYLQPCVWPEGGELFLRLPNTRRQGQHASPCGQAPPWACQGRLRS